MSTDKSAPRVIADRYEVRDLIGRGAFGEVFEVYDHRLNRLVALKTLPITQGGGAEAEEERRRFQMEARSVARLSHPGIVTVHDFGETPDFAWIAMELIIGETLKDVLDQGDRPSLPETVRVVCALLDALHYAHGRGIVHRDVKPANVLLALGAEDGLGAVRLADFGIARIGEAQTVAGQIIGTPTAMSPEQVRGEEVDLRSDLWSAGVVLYQMLTGKRPFSGQMPAIFNSILTSRPAPPSELVPELPQALDEVVAKALAKNPKDRYPDALTMAAAIRAAATPPPVWDIFHDSQGDTVRLPAPPPVPAPPPPAPARRGFGVPALVASFGAGLVCGVLLCLAFWPRDLIGPGVPAAAPVTESAVPAPSPLAGSGNALLSPAGEPPPLPPEPALPSQADFCMVPAKDPRVVRPLAEPVAEEPQVAAPVPPPASPVEAPSPPAPAAAPLTAPVVRSAAGPHCGAQRLAVEPSDHAGFGRIALNWGVPIRYSFRLVEGGASVRFPGADCLPDLAQAEMPRNVRGIHVEEDGQGVRIEAMAGARIQFSRQNRNRAVIDIFDTPESHAAAPR